MGSQVSGLLKIPPATETRSFSQSFSDLGARYLGCSNKSEPLLFLEGIYVVSSLNPR